MSQKETVQKTFVAEQDKAEGGVSHKKNSAEEVCCIKKWHRIKVPRKELHRRIIHLKNGKMIRNENRGALAAP